MPYQLLNILAVAVPVIWGHPLDQGGWKGLGTQNPDEMFSWHRSEDCTVTGDRLVANLETHLTEQNHFYE